MVSIVIPTCNDEQNLAFTVHAWLEELHDIQAEIIIAANCCTDGTVERFSNCGPALDGRLSVVECNDVQSVTYAKNKGTLAASGEYIMYLCGHVVPKRGSGVQAFQWVQERSPCVLHLGYNYLLDTPGRTLYQYVWQPEKFWGRWTRQSPGADWQILMSGGCGAICHKETWIGLGMYSDHYRGWGCTEIMLDAKHRMNQFEVYCNPDWQFYHLAAKRSYSWTGIDLKRNAMIGAFVIGGNSWLERRLDAYREENKGHPDWIANIEDVASEVRTFCAEERLKVTQYPLTWDDVLAEWGEGIAHG